MPSFVKEVEEMKAKKTLKISEFVLKRPVHFIFNLETVIQTHKRLEWTPLWQNAAWEVWG